MSQSHVVWRGKEPSRIGTPVYDDGRIYWVGMGRVANCINAADGKQVYQTRFGSGAPGAGAGPGPRPGFGPGPGSGPGPGGDGKGKGKGKSGGGRPGGGGRGGFGMDYASPVFAQGRIYFQTRTGEMLVYTAGPECKLLAQNKLADGGDFSATPAISDGQLFVRSSKSVYCIGKKN